MHRNLLKNNVLNAIIWTYHLSYHLRRYFVCYYLELSIFKRFIKNLLHPVETLLQTRTSIMVNWYFPISN